MSSVFFVRIAPSGGTFLLAESREFSRLNFSNSIGKIPHEKRSGGDLEVFSIFFYVSPHFFVSLIDIAGVAVSCGGYHLTLLLTKIPVRKGPLKPFLSL